MTNKLNNLSAFVPYQLPEFIREDNPGIVAFIEAYYEWLDAETDYLRSPMRLGEVVDIDTTMDIFLNRFRKQYLLDFPESLAYNKKSGKPLDEKILIKNIKDFYRAKGTEKTYKFLFRILYDSDVNISYPKTNILRLSDGKWVKKKSIKTLHTSGKNIFECVGKTILQRDTLTREIIASGSVLDINSVSTQQTNIHQVSQIYFTSTNGTFLTGTQYPIEFFNNSGDLITEPRLFSCVQSVTISNGGTGYIVGDSVVFSSDTQTGQASGRVSQINSLTGAIQKIKIENPGLGYDFVPTASIISTNGVGFIGTVSIGALIVEEGYYTNNDGRLSTNKVMQDNHYFQEFSYVIETDAVLKKYKEAVLRLLHPIGTAFFSKAKIQRCVTGHLDKQTSINNYEIPYISHYNCYSLNTYDNLYDWFQSEELITSATGGRSYYTDRLVPIHYYPTIHDQQLLEGNQNPITNHVGVLVAAGTEFGADILRAGTIVSSTLYSPNNPMVRFATTEVAEDADDLNNQDGTPDGGYTGDGVLVGDGAELDILGLAGSNLFVVYPHPNTRLIKPQLIKVPISLKSEFLGGAAGVTGYWHEWTRSITAQRQEWASGFTDGSKNAYLQFDRNTEFKKINIGGFLGIPLGSEFVCNDTPIKDSIPKITIKKINGQTPPTSVKDAVGVYSVFGETDDNGGNTVSTIFENRGLSGVAGEFRVELELHNTENIDSFSIPCHTGLKADLYLYRKDTNKGILLQTKMEMEALIPNFSIIYNQNGKIQKNNPRTIFAGETPLQARDALLLRVYYVNKLGFPITGSESEVYFQYSPHTVASDDVILEDETHPYPVTHALSIGGKTGSWNRNDLTDEYGVPTPVVSGLGNSDIFDIVYSQSYTGSFDYFKIPYNGLRAVIYSYDHDRGTDFNLFYRAIWTSTPLSVTGSSFRVNLQGKGLSIDAGDKTDPYYTKHKPLILVFQYVNKNGVPIGENGGYDWLDTYGYAPGATYPVYIDDGLVGVTASDYRHLPYPRPWSLFNFLFRDDA